MTENKYIVYSVLDVVMLKISIDVAQSIKEEVAFKYRYFQHTDDQPNQEKKCRSTINVYPFREFKEGFRDVTVSHDYRYSLYDFCSSPSRQLCVQKTKSGLDIFTDGENIIDLLVLICLVTNGYALVHAAGVEKENQAILLCGMGGIGKTQFAASFIFNSEFSVLGDDLIIISENGYAYPFLKPFMLKPQHKDFIPSKYSKNKLGKVLRGLKNKFIIFMKDNLPLAGLIKSFLKKDTTFTNTLRQFLQFNSVDLIPTYPWEIEGLYLSEGAKCCSLIQVHRSLGPQIGSYEQKANNADINIAIIINEYRSTIWALGWMGSAGVVDIEYFYENLHKVYKKFLSEVDIKNFIFPIEMEPKEYISSLITSITGEKDPQ